MYSLSLAALLAATLVTAAPADTLLARETKQIAKFDNIKGSIPGVSVSPVNGNGIYQKIYWRGFSLAEFGLPVADNTLPVKRPGVTPDSPSNVIAFATDDVQTLQGGGAFMDSVYASSPISSINLYSFYYGCTSASEASLTAAPLSCKITVKCNRKDGTKVAPQTFPFSVAVAQTTAEMKKASVTGFSKCQNVEFQVSGLTTAGLVDTVDYGTN